MNDRTKIGVLAICSAAVLIAVLTLVLVKGLGSAPGGTLAVQIDTWDFTIDDNYHFHFYVVVKNNGPSEQNIIINCRVTTTTGSYSNTEQVSLNPGDTGTYTIRVGTVPNQAHIQKVECWTSQ